LTELSEELEKKHKVEVISIAKDLSTNKNLSDAFD